MRTDTTGGLAKRIGERARAARNARGLTQAHVAEEIDLAVEVYGRLERGGMLPSVPTLVKLADALRVTPDSLLLEARPPSRRAPKQPPELLRVVRLLERADRRKLRLILLVVRAMVQ